ncbi:uncharacterized protein LOC103313345 isoform X2 [Tribolium castaneum]|uniref:uncharacterized protein LOC103313345 isoform X2 n=1 Tax=Tribolium castaneum TaxID=7070 RepID=UPI0030FE2330
MSTSTIFIKRPLNYRQSFALLKEKYKDLSPALSLILWTISGIYAASRNSFNQNVSGLILSFLVSDLIVMTFASIVLCKGLIDYNPANTVDEPHGIQSLFYALPRHRKHVNSPKTTEEDIVVALEQHSCERSAPDCARDPNHTNVPTRRTLVV